MTGCVGMNSSYVPCAPSPRHTYPRSNVIVIVVLPCGDIRRTLVNVRSPPTA
jgi:hypothetical protein